MIIEYLQRPIPQHEYREEMNHFIVDAEKLPKGKYYRSLSEHDYLRIDTFSSLHLIEYIYTKQPALIKSYLFQYSEI